MGLLGSASSFPQSPFPTVSIDLYLQQKPNCIPIWLETSTDSTSWDANDGFLIMAPQSLHNLDPNLLSSFISLLCFFILYILTNKTPFFLIDCDLTCHQLYWLTPSLCCNPDSLFFDLMPFPNGCTTIVQYHASLPIPSLNQHGYQG